MAAGLNIKANIWRITFPEDDEVGGAIPSGTVIYSNYPIRFESKMPDQAFFEQGVETLKTFNVSIRPSTLIIYERDELEISWPHHHKLFGKRFRVVGVGESNFHPSDHRGYLLLTVTRSDRAHGNQ